MTEPGDRQTLPVACALTPEDGPARIRRWQLLHERAAPTAESSAGRLELRYPPADGVTGELRELAAAEQVCCAFATWVVTDHDGGPTLSVTAAEEPEALAAVAALFGVRAPLPGPGGASRD